MKNKIKFGLLGCGYWGPNFIRIILNSNSAQLLKVCDTDVSKLARFNKIHADIELTENTDDLINDRRIDAVIVCTPVLSHFELTKKLLLAGKHVLCEKPLAYTSAECLELNRIASSANKILLVGHIFEYNAVIQYMRQMILNKKLGDMLYLQFIRTGLGPVRSDVNVVYDLAAHDISILHFLLQEIPISVSAIGSSFIRAGVEDVAFIHLEFPDKVLASINVSWIDPMKQRIVKVVGSKKMLLFDDVSVSEKLKIIETGKDYQITSGDFGSFQLSIKDGEITIPNLSYPEPLLTEFNHFINCILGNEIVLTNAEQAYKVVKVIECIQNSLKNNGAKVLIP